jgi:tRNA(Ile)-lysidine synthase
LLGWGRAELEAICDEAGLAAAHDPSNADERFERARLRRALADADWLDPGAVARSAANLADADDALRWATDQEWRRAVDERRDRISYRRTDAPREIVRRVVERTVRKLATEGDPDLRGAELDRLLATLGDGGTATLRGVRCSGGSPWRFERAALRR